MQGIVIKNTGSWYTVLTDEGQQIESKIKGKFRLQGIRSTNPVAVGDRVTIVVNAEGTALITAIEERRNYIIRRSSNLSKQSHIIAANVDQACLVVTVREPETSTTFIDRFLATAEAYSIPVVLVFNKVDLLAPADHSLQEHLISLYTALDYRCIALSALTGEGMTALQEMLKDRITLFSGNSGVGKSTLLNRILPHAALRTAEISAAHHTGTHTTTHSQMLPLPEGGWVIDTPGIKGFGSFDMKPEEICSYFREIFRESEHCRFNNCTHTHEPGCAVLQAVTEGRISESRYRSYLSMMDDHDENKYREAY